MMEVRAQPRNENAGKSYGPEQAGRHQPHARGLEVIEMNEHETKPVWIVWVNSDLTEGRGQMIPVRVCSSESTAIRLGKGRNVQGSDARISQHDAIWHRNAWCAPVEIINPSQEDLDADARRETARAADRRRAQALERARQAGLSEDDIAILGGVS